MIASPAPGKAPMSEPPPDPPDGAYLTDDGLWVHQLRPLAGRPRPALFLDRDGVIIEDVGHVRRPEDVALIAGSAEVIATANCLGVPVVVVTNQSGLGRNIFTWDDFIAVQQRMVETLAEAGAHLDLVIACPHHQEGVAPYDHPDHPGRKPNPGMLLRAADIMPLDLGLSWIVGDRWRDIVAGSAAGLAGGVHVSTRAGERPGERDRAGKAAARGFRVICAGSLRAAWPVLPFPKFSANAGDSAPPAAEPT